MSLPGIIDTKEWCAEPSDYGTSSSPGIVNVEIEGSPYGDAISYILSLPRR